MRNFGSGRHLVINTAAALLSLLGAGSASADGPRPYLVGASDLQGQADWSGFYIGGKLGGAWSDDISWTQNPNVFTNGGAVPPGTKASFSASGVDGGIIGGGNLMVGHWVFGLELSYSGVDLSQTITSPFFPATDTFTTEINQLGTIEGRIGYAFDHYLVFGKGGWAASNAKITLTNAATGVTASSDDFIDGFTIGGGVEFLAGSNFVLGLEYDFVDLSIGNVPTCLGCVANNAPTSLSGDVDFSTVMVRASYLFMGED